MTALMLKQQERATACCQWDDDCNRGVRGRDLCSKHYQAAVAAGRLDEFRRADRVRAVAVEDAGGGRPPHVWSIETEGDWYWWVCTCGSRGRSNRDFAKTRRSGGLHVREYLGTVAEGLLVRLCSYPRCPRKHYARGYCGGHHQQIRRGIELSPLRPKRMKKFAPGSERRGYRYTSVNGVYDLEHRHVMEQIIGRPLLPFENVHHKNGVRSDNRPENLELWVTPQPPGQRAADLVVWAHEILARYGELVAETPVGVTATGEAVVAPTGNVGRDAA